MIRDVYGLSANPNDRQFSEREFLALVNRAYAMQGQYGYREEFGLDAGRLTLRTTGESGREASATLSFPLEPDALSSVRGALARAVKGRA